MDRKRVIILAGFAIALVSIGFSIQAASETVVCIEPAYQHISPGMPFSFNVSCKPMQPVKSFELKLSFDPDLLQIHEITEGSLFDGFQRFPNLGTIDNSTGHILDVFNLILGPGNVTLNGTCICISGTSTDTSGNASIHLYDVGVTNETGYLPITVIDGYILSEDMIIMSDPSPSDGATNIGKDRSSLSVTILHKQGELFNYSISTSPHIGSFSAVNQSNGSKTCAISGLSFDRTYSWTVSVQETSSGNWTTQTFSFTTESDDDTGGGGGSGGGIAFPPPPAEEPDQNNPPATPLRPSGPLYIEPGVNYLFETSGYDPDDDLVRFRFDWGDGTVSNWTEYVSSNQTVSSLHQWNGSANFSIMVRGQDEPGLNSSWSPILTVICKSTDIQDVGTPPIANFTFPDDLLVNTSIEFNASSSSDIDDDIISYVWDFGDGTNGSGMNPIHQYAQPGIYQVTLVVSDSKGYSFSKTSEIIISSPYKEKTTGDDAMMLYIGVFLGGFSVVIIVFLRWEQIRKVLFGTRKERIERSYSAQIFKSDETVLDGIRKVFDLGHSLHLPFPKDSTSFDKSFQMNTKPQVASADSINDENQETDRPSPPSMDQITLNEQQQQEQSNDPVVSFFEKHSLHDVRKRVDALPFHQRQKHHKNIKHNNEKS